MNMRVLCASFSLILLLTFSRTTITAAAPYYLAEKDGRVCVFDAANDRWLRESTVPAASLPKRDRELLRRGIPLYSEKQVTAALEDFCS